MLRFYEDDIFGRLVLKDPKYVNDLSNGFKNAKVNKIIFDSFYDYIKKRNFYRLNKSKRRFFYRIDIIKPKRRRRRMTLYAQKLKIRYEIRKFCSQMSVRQFNNYLYKSARGSSLYKKFIKFLECRIDFIIFRSNIFETSNEARQFINHNFVVLNGLTMKFSNCKIYFNDVVSFKNKALLREKLLNLFKQKKIYSSVPSFLEINYRMLTITLVHQPSPDYVFYPFKKRRFGIGFSFTPLISSAKRF